MRRSVILAVLATLVLGACAQPPIPEDHFYRLASRGPERAPSGTLPAGTILVERFLADGITAGRPIAYSDAARANVLQTYHYHYWIEPPTILLQTALAEYLRKAGAQQVVTPDLRVEPDVSIAGRIRGFEQVRGATGFVRAHLELAVTERKSGRLMLFKSYTAEPRTSGDSVAEAAQQMSLAVDQIFAQFLRDLTHAR